MLWNVWLGMVIVGVLLLATSIILTFVLRIPELLDELSGRKEKRQVKRLRELNVGITEALEGVDTEDFYQSMSGGSSLAEEMVIEPVDINEFMEGKQKQVTKKSVNIPRIDLSDDEKSTSDMEESSNVEVPTSDLDGEISTGYMSEENEATSYIDSSDVTNILSDIKQFNNTKHTVEVIEEQSSI